MRLKTFIKNNPIFLISLGLAIIMVILGRFDYRDINHGVILTIFGMMLTLGGLDHSGFLADASVRLIALSQNTRRLVFSMVLLSFIASFFLTNDVTVMTLLPIYLVILHYIPPFKGRILGAALIPVAANLGGIFFPFSNPQNLIIFDYYPLTTKTFITWTTPLLLVSFILVMAFPFFVERRSLETTIQKKTIGISLFLESLLGLLLMVFTVLGILPLIPVIILVILWALLRHPYLFKKGDYSLLGVFTCFFIILGNITTFSVVKNFLEELLQSDTSVFLGGILLSQGLSNVPTTILLTPFTSSARALLLGVNIGGLGTLVASLTNLIGYSLFKKYFPEEKHFFKIFTGVNLLLLLILSLIFWFTL